MKTLAASAIAVLTVGAWFTWTLGPPDPAIDADTLVAAPARSVVPRTVSPRKPPPATQRALAASTATPSLAARIELLRASADPNDAYRAYRLIAGCLRAREFDAYVTSLPMTAEHAAERAANAHAARRVNEACQDISPVQIAQRLAMAERAARAGVPGAAAAWTAEGPFGDKTALAQRPDDPLVVEWAQQAIEMIKAATKRGDVDAIGQFGLLCMNWELDEVDKLKVVLNDATERDMHAQAAGGLRVSQRMAAGASGADVIDAPDVN
jgi:hypothetical protein